MAITRPAESRNICNPLFFQTEIFQRVTFPYLDNYSRLNFFKTNKVHYSLPLKEPSFTYHYTPLYMVIFVGRMVPGEWYGYTPFLEYPDLYTRFSVIEASNTKKEGLNQRLFSTRSLADEQSRRHSWYKSFEGYVIATCWVRPEEIKPSGEYVDVECKVLNPSSEIIPRQIYIHEMYNYVRSYGRDPSRNKYSRCLIPLEEKEQKRINTSSFQAEPLLCVLQSVTINACSHYLTWYRHYKKDTRVLRTIKHGWHTEEEKKSARKFVQQLMEVDQSHEFLQALFRRLMTHPISDIHSLEAYLVTHIASHVLLRLAFDIPQRLLSEDETVETCIALQTRILATIAKNTPHLQAEYATYRNQSELAVSKKEWEGLAVTSGVLTLGFSILSIVTGGLFIPAVITCAITAYLAGRNACQDKTTLPNKPTFFSSSKTPAPLITAPVTTSSCPADLPRLTS